MGTTECISGLAIMHFLGYRCHAHAWRLHLWTSCLAAWRLRFIQLGAMAKGIFFVLILYRVTAFTYLTAAWLDGRTSYDATTVRRRKGRIHYAILYALSRL